MVLRLHQRPRETAVETDSDRVRSHEPHSLQQPRELSRTSTQVRREQHHEQVTHATEGIADPHQAVTDRSRGPMRPKTARSMNAGATGVVYSAAAGTASDVPAITRSAAPVSTAGVASPRGRRTATAMSPTASHTAGRGNQRDARSSHRPSPALASRSEKRSSELVHATVHAVEVCGVARVVRQDLVRRRQTSRPRGSDRRASR